MHNADPNMCTLACSHHHHHHQPTEQATKQPTSQQASQPTANCSRTKTPNKQQCSVFMCQANKHRGITITRMVSAVAIISPELQQHTPSTNPPPPPPPTPKPVPMQSIRCRSVCFQSRVPRVYPGCGLPVPRVCTEISAARKFKQAKQTRRAAATLSGGPAEHVASITSPCYSNIPSALCPLFFRTGAGGGRGGGGGRGWGC